MICGLWLENRREKNSGRRDTLRRLSDGAPEETYSAASHKIGSHFGAFVRVFPIKPGGFPHFVR